MARCVVGEHPDLAPTAANDQDAGMHVASGATSFKPVWCLTPSAANSSLPQIITSSCRCLKLTEQYFPKRESAPARTNQHTLCMALSALCHMTQQLTQPDVKVPKNRFPARSLFASQIGITIVLMIRRDGAMAMRIAPEIDFDEHAALLQVFEPIIPS